MRDVIDSNKDVGEDEVKGMDYNGASGGNENKNSDNYGKGQIYSGNTNNKDPRNKNFK